LGAIKAGHGTDILAAGVRAKDCRLRPDLVLDHTGPVLPLAAFSRSQLPTIEQAEEWLADINSHLMEVEAFERHMRRQVEQHVPELKERLAPLSEEFEAMMNRLARRHRRLLKRQIASLKPPLTSLGLETAESLQTAGTGGPSCVERAVFQDLLREAWTEMLKQIREGLDKLEGEILILRYGLADGHARTLEEVARAYNLTRARVRRLESKALNKLQHLFARKSYVSTIHPYDLTIRIGGRKIPAKNVLIHLTPFAGSHCI